MRAAHADGEAAGEVFVARQPIFNTKQQLFAYELLYRSSRENAFDGADSTQATSHVISNSLLTIGLERLVHGRRAFINFDRNMLLNGYAAVLPRQTVVVEILENVEPDDEVIAVARQLKQQGYSLALDDFSCADGYDELLKLVDIVKVDLRLTSPELRALFARRYGPRTGRIPPGPADGLLLVPRVLFQPARNRRRPTSARLQAELSAYPQGSQQRTARLPGDREDPQV